MADVAAAVAAIRAGELVVLPTDTVYGLACAADREDAVRALSELKGRPSSQPIALLAASLDNLYECLPELSGRAALVASSLLPGPYTLVVPNPARRFDWLAGERTDTLGIRVPVVPPDAASVLDQVEIVAATSANRHGEADPRRLDDVPDHIRAAVAAALDAGELPGVPSTVVDLTCPEPCVLRAGAVPSGEALERVAAALR